MKFTFSLFQKLVLIFWVPVLIYLLFMVYLPIKHVKYNPKTQLNLPEEHKQLLSVVQEVEASAKPKEVELAVLKTNPFYKEALNLGKADTQSLPKTILRLSSIIQMPERNICIINNKPYYVGSVVEGYKIYKIGEYYVELKGPKGRVKLEVGGVLAL
ncbi:MAG: hypothetical protein LM575_03500 [Caldimicrobium sp.]|nr:hypothetical protein [Caldimicrobium sp.]